MNRIFVTSRIQNQNFSFGNTSVASIREVVKSLGFILVKNINHADVVIIPDNVPKLMMIDSRMIKWSQWAKQLHQKHQKPDHKHKTVRYKISDSPFSPLFLKDQQPEPEPEPKPKPEPSHNKSSTMYQTQKPLLEPPKINQQQPLPLPHDEKKSEQYQFQQTWNQQFDMPNMPKAQSKEEEAIPEWKHTALFSYQEISAMMNLCLGAVPELPPREWTINQVTHASLTNIDIYQQTPFIYDWKVGTHRLNQVSQLFPVLTSLVRYFNVLILDAWNHIPQVMEQVMEPKHQALINDTAPLLIWQQTIGPYLSQVNQIIGCNSLKACFQFMICMMSLYRWASFHAKYMEQVFQQTWHYHKQWVVFIRQFMNVSSQQKTYTCQPFTGLFVILSDQACIRLPLWLTLSEMSEAIRFPEPSLHTIDIQNMDVITQELRHMVTTWKLVAFQDIDPSATSTNLTKDHILLYYIHLMNECLKIEFTSYQRVWLGSLPDQMWKKMNRQQFETIPWHLITSAQPQERFPLWQILFSWA